MSGSPNSGPDDAIENYYVDPDRKNIGDDPIFVYCNALTTSLVLMVSNFSCIQYSIIIGNSWILIYEIVID